MNITISLTELITFIGVIVVPFTVWNFNLANRILILEREIKNTKEYNQKSDLNIKQEEDSIKYDIQKVNEKLSSLIDYINGYISSSNKQDYKIFKVSKYHRTRWDE